MPRNRRRFVGPLAGVASAALGLSGLFAGSAAFAQAPTDEPAPTSGSAYEQQVKTLLAGDDAVQAAGRGKNGEFVVMTTAAPNATTQSFTESHNNVRQIRLASPLESLAATDVVGGAGYAGFVDVDSPQASLCSVGFSAWSPQGEPAIITAGHCANDKDASNPANTITALTVPADDTAGGGTTPSLVTGLGTFGFHQFGGANNTAGADGDKNSIDAAVIDVKNTSLNLQPRVTDWSNTSDLAASSTPIKSIGTATAGATVSKSGRTTGLTSGVVEAVDGWANVSGHFVYGFGVLGAPGAPKPISDHGDSGGAVFQGTTAVGVVSGGGEAENGGTILWAADLQNDLAHTGGYTVQLAIDAPTITSPASGATIKGGAAITGTGPAGADVLVTPKGQPSATVKVDATGHWTYSAPQKPGDYEFSLVAKRGFDTSPAAALKVTVELGAPAIASPANGSTLTEAPTAVSGTGVPGATVTVTGAVEGTVTVAADGSWSIPATGIQLGRGQTVTASQTFNGQTSGAATSTFNVVPVAPAVTSPKSGATFASDAAPTEVTGTGAVGATVTVTLNGKPVGTATVAANDKSARDAGPTADAVQGAWTLKLGANVLWGANTLSVTQAIDGVASDPVQVTFTVTAPASPVAPGPNQGGTTGADLANTGSDVSGFGAVGAVVLALGIAVVAMRRRAAVK